MTSGADVPIFALPRKDAQAKIDSIVVKDSCDCTVGWISRASVRFYNVHVSLDHHTYRVGESRWLTSPIWVFDQNGYQWAEFNSVPDCCPSMKQP